MILSALQVAQVARDAGFAGTQLVTAVAIAHAESGFNSSAIGDVNLTEPGERSVGLWQINWRPSRDRADGFRDPTLNLDPAHNAAAAFQISGRGSRFTPWSTFTSGAYKPFLAGAQTAVDSLPPIPPIGAPVPLPATIINFVPSPTGKGYWIVFSDGAVFAFGDALYAGRVVLDANNVWRPA